MEVEVKAKFLSILYANVTSYKTLIAPQLEEYWSKIIPDVIVLFQENNAVYNNTWEDNLLAYFCDPKEAATCALALRDYFQEREWGKTVLPKDTDVRIALHFAPVQMMKKPADETFSIIGTKLDLSQHLDDRFHTGQVFCTARFADQLEPLLDSEFSMEDLGEYELSLGWGKSEVYFITRKDDRDTTPLIEEKMEAKKLNTDDNFFLEPETNEFFKHKLLSRVKILEEKLEKYELKKKSLTSKIYIALSTFAAKILAIVVSFLIIYWTYSKADASLAIPAFVDELAAFVIVIMGFWAYHSFNTLKFYLYQNHKLGEILLDSKKAIEKALFITKSNELLGSEL